MNLENRRQQSLRDYYDNQIDTIIKKALNRASLSQLASAAKIELGEVSEFSAETRDELRAYCSNFYELVTMLSEHGLIENRRFTPESAKTLVEVMIEKLEHENDLGVA